jgi:hypothetical protein
VQKSADGMHAGTRIMRAQSAGASLRRRAVPSTQEGAAAVSSDRSARPAPRTSVQPLPPRHPDMDADDFPIKPESSRAEHMGPLKRHRGFQSSLGGHTVGAGLQDGAAVSTATTESLRQLEANEGSGGDEVALVAADIPQQAGHVAWENSGFQDAPMDLRECAGGRAESDGDRLTAFLHYSGSPIRIGLHDAAEGLGGSGVWNNAAGETDVAEHAIRGLDPGRHRRTMESGNGHEDLSSTAGRVGEGVLVTAADAGAVGIAQSDTAPEELFDVEVALHKQRFGVDRERQLQVRKKMLELGVAEEYEEDGVIHEDSSMAEAALDASLHVQEGLQTVGQVIGAAAASLLGSSRKRYGTEGEDGGGGQASEAASQAASETAAAFGEDWHSDCGSQIRYGAVPSSLGGIDDNIGASCGVGDIHHTAKYPAQEAARKEGSTPGSAGTASGVAGQDLRQVAGVCQGTGREKGLDASGRSGEDESTLVGDSSQHAVDAVLGAEARRTSGEALGAASKVERQEGDESGAAGAHNEGFGAAVAVGSGSGSAPLAGAEEICKGKKSAVGPETRKGEDGEISMAGGSETRIGVPEPSRAGGRKVCHGEEDGESIKGGQSAHDSHGDAVEIRRHSAASGDTVRM